jgi:predicted DNA-binding transcriptional regulator YafY
MLPSRVYSDITRVTRLLKIIAHLRQRGPKEQIGRKLLAQEFGCDPRTIQRDVELLQVTMHLPLIYDRSSKTYTLQQAEEAPLSVSFTAEEALALALARGILTASGFPLKDAVLAALDKATVQLPVALQRDLAQVTETLQAAEVLQAEPLARDYSQAPLAALVEAARSQQTLELHYQSRSSQQLTWRRVDPYEVALRNGQNWELHGWCHTRQAIRTFALDKILQVHPTSALFARHEQEWKAFQDVGAVLGGLRGEAPVTVQVIFDADVAAYALDRQWPKTLRLTVLPDGCVQMTGTAQGTQGLVVELLSWRRYALVKGGPELRAQMEAEVQAIAARYEEDNYKEDRHEKDSREKRG